MKSADEHQSATERRFPLIVLTPVEAERLLEPLRGHQRVVSLKLLKGGHINSNYKVELEGASPVVLRIYASGEIAFRKEISLLRRFSAVLPVPSVHLAGFEPQFFEHPYGVLEWMDGVALNEALETDPGAASEIGSALVSVLSELGKEVLAEYPGTPLFDHIKNSLFEGGGCRFISEEKAWRLLDLVERQSAFMRSLEKRECIVHGDFQGDNILLQKSENGWRVKAVLDWEWANNGSHLQDLGSLLRYQGAAASDFQRGLELGFIEAGFKLPDEWRMAARLWDAAAHCEKLAFPRHRGEVTLRSIRMIDNLLTDYATKNVSSQPAHPSYRPIICFFEQRFSFGNKRLMGKNTRQDSSRSVLGTFDSGSSRKYGYRRIASPKLVQEL